MNIYKKILPESPIQGKLGYYPVSNSAEWDNLPDLYKVMEWEPVKDPHNNGELKAVKSVIFDVPHIEPYGIRGKMFLHPENVQKILFCNYDKADCHLYSISGVELEGGTQLPAKWLQDSVTGSFAIYVNGQYAGKQGGFGGYIPEHIQTLEDGSFKYDFKYNEGKTAHYALLNPFKNLDKDIVPTYEQESVFKGDFSQVTKALKKAYVEGDTELASYFATCQAPDLSIEDTVRLYSDLKQEIDGDQVFEFKEETGEVMALWSLDEPFYDKEDILALFSKYIDTKELLTPGIAQGQNIVSDAHSGLKPVLNDAITSVPDLLPKFDQEFTVEETQENMEQNIALFDKVPSDFFRELFKFDDEILILDDNKVLNGYLCSTIPLVSRLKEQMRDILRPEELEAMENISFYADYYVETVDIRLLASYDTPAEDGELNKIAEIVLSTEEKKELISVFEEYCSKNQDGRTCLGFINDARAEDGLLPLVPLSNKPSLFSQIQSAEIKSSITSSKTSESAKVPESER